MNKHISVTLLAVFTAAFLFGTEVQAASITGLLADADTGEAIDGAKLELFDLSGGDTPTRVGVALSKQAGDFQFKRVGAGEYILKISPNSAGLQWGYFQGDTDWRTAQPVTVERGETVDLGTVFVGPPDFQIKGVDVSPNHISSAGGVLRVSAELLNHTGSPRTVRVWASVRTETYGCLPECVFSMQDLARMVFDLGTVELNPGTNSFAGTITVPAGAEPWHYEVWLHMGESYWRALAGAPSLTGFFDVGKEGQ